MTIPLLEKMPFKGETIYKGDPRVETFRRDAVIAGDPDAVVRPKEWKDVVDIISWCNGNRVPLTVCGARTSMTGSSVAMSGVLITTDRFNKLLDLGTKSGRPYAVVQPGVVALDLQKAVEEKGFHYPAVPTSCDNAFMGGIVSTNATGEDFYRYGATRNYVREITLIKPDGKEATFRRSEDDVPKISKGLGGYYLGGSAIDRIIGSEGTLGIIKQVVFDLLPKIPQTYVIMAPFASNKDALAFIDSVNRGAKKPRCLEFIDTRSLELIKECPKCPKIPEHVKAFVYIKDEADGDINKGIEEWAAIIPESALNDSIIAVTDKQKQEMHELRHFIPSRISELNELYQKDGGGKTSGDWWVPKDKILKVMDDVFNEASCFNDFFAYGHLGDGHPHTSYLCHDPEELKKAKELVLAQSKRAVALGGGAAAEHGIGKIKHQLLAIQHGADVIEKMRALKSEFDPNWILGRGNILAP